MQKTQTRTKTNNFVSGPILPTLLQFAFPLMLSLLLQAFYGGVDLAVVGQFAPTESISAVATGSQVMQVVTSLISGLSMSITVAAGQGDGCAGLSECWSGNMRADQAVFADCRGFDGYHAGIYAADCGADECSGGRNAGNNAVYSYLFIGNYLYYGV